MTAEVGWNNCVLLVSVAPPRSFIVPACRCMGVLQTSVLAMELEGGGLADGRILQLVQVSIGRVCYQQG